MGKHAASAAILTDEDIERIVNAVVERLREKQTLPVPNWSSPTYTWPTWPTNTPRIWCQ